MRAHGPPARPIGRQTRRTRTTNLIAAARLRAAPAGTAAPRGQRFPSQSARRPTHLCMQRGSNEGPGERSAARAHGGEHANGRTGQGGQRFNRAGKNTQTFRRYFARVLSFRVRSLLIRQDVLNSPPPFQKKVSFENPKQKAKIWRYDRLQCGGECLQACQFSAFKFGCQSGGKQTCHRICSVVSNKLTKIRTSGFLFFAVFLLRATVRQSSSWVRSQ